MKSHLRRFQRPTWGCTKSSRVTGRQKSHKPSQLSSSQCLKNKRTPDNLSHKSPTSRPLPRRVLQLIAHCHQQRPTTRLRSRISWSKSSQGSARAVWSQTPRWILSEVQSPTSGSSHKTSIYRDMQTRKHLTWQTSIWKAKGSLQSKNRQFQSR